jgi:hypothetical protein
MIEAALHSQAIGQAVPQGKRIEKLTFTYDIWLIGVVLTLLCVGLIMVVSTSVSIAERRDLAPLYYFWRQLGAAGLGIAVAVVLMKIPLPQLERFSSAISRHCPARRRAGAGIGARGERQYALDGVWSDLSAAL